MARNNDRLIAAEQLKAQLVGRATGESSDDAAYAALRGQLLGDPLTRDRLPRFVRSCRNLSEWWGHIKPKFSTYAERRAYVAEQFDSLLTFLEDSATAPSDDSVETALRTMDWTHVQEAWRRAQDRRTEDPEGAITAARTMLETVCKHILDERRVVYDEKLDLPQLYRTAAKELNLAPEQHQEEVFRQILGGCSSVIGGLAGLRNRLSDAHGKSKTAMKPAPRHAELAVNLAGTMASFLIATHEARPRG